MLCGSVFLYEFSLLIAIRYSDYFSVSFDVFKFIGILLVIITYYYLFNVSRCDDICYFVLDIGYLWFLSLFPLINISLSFQMTTFWLKKFFSYVDITSTSLTSNLIFVCFFPCTFCGLNFLFFSWLLEIDIKIIEYF